MYGWSAAPLYTFGSGVWPLSDDIFARLVHSRQPFWATITRDDARTYRVYFLNDQGGIYALGYPIVTTFGHLVNLAELIFLTVVLYPLLVGAVKIFNAVASPRPASGRALLREVRSSFYRKLWLAFVGVVLVPVLILALASRTYFDSQFRAGVKEDAVKTATVAQRIVEDYATIERQGSGAFDTLDDEVMVLVSQAIDQDVNLFDPKRLQATSERDLFASGMLPVRTPSDVYQAVVLDRLPTFVFEDVGVGGSSYLLAAAPVRAGQRQGIVTVPLTLRAQEADQQIDNLDRQVLFASVFFVLLGAGLGYWMAERIADPVSRLTRATRRIARGDLDARIAATSSRRGSDASSRTLQPHGRRSEASARRAPACPAARSVGGHGETGRARHQEPPHADSAVSRARAAGQHRPRASALAGARRLRQRDPHAGQAAAPDLG